MLEVSSNAFHILAEDIASILQRVTPHWEALRNARIFMTGGTGFIGRWMLESFVQANKQHDLDASIVVLTRNPDRFAAAAPHLYGNPAVRFVLGDVLTLRHDGEQYSHVIHGATDASAALNEDNPLLMFDTVLSGTRTTLEFARASNVKRFLLMSSGAVYGPQPWDIKYVPETNLGGPDIMSYRSAYGEGKRAAELLATIYRKQHGLDVVSARIFALLGPLLSLDIHFAAGNFILDALAKRPVVVNSDGRAERSYLYIADLISWLWTLLLRAPVGSTYNLGSEEAISVGDLAARVTKLLGGPSYKILGQPDIGWNPGRYVPSSRLFRETFDMEPTVTLDEAIRRTAIWNGWNG